MDDIRSIGDDDSLELNSSPGKVASDRKVSSDSRGRPRSAKSAMTTSRNRKTNGPVTAPTARSRGKTKRRQQGLKGRIGGDGAGFNAGSSSAPQLQRAAAITVAETNTYGSSSMTAMRSANNSVDFGVRGRRGKLRASLANSDAVSNPASAQQSEDETASIIDTKDYAPFVQHLEARNEEVESRCRQLENRCTELEAEATSKVAELKSYKAEVRAKIIAVGKAEIILNEVCVSTARRVGLAEGTHISDNKGGVLLEVHESPAEFAAKIKKNILAQLSKWEIDRAALRAAATTAGEKASEVAKVHAAECAELSARSQHLEERIRCMEQDNRRQVAESQVAAEQSRRECETVYSKKEELTRQLSAAVTRNQELSKKVEEGEKEYQIQLDRFMEYPKAAEKMAEELDSSNYSSYSKARCQKSARREKNLMHLERKEFRRQLYMFQRWQTENKELREKAKLQEAQALALRRQLAATEAGMAGDVSTRKAVMGGTVDRLQRAESAATHQANKYRELAGARGVRIAQLEAEVTSLKGTIKNLRLKLEPNTNDTYEMEVARLARAHPEILEIQQRSGLNKEDMHASVAQLKLLREKEEQKDALIGLVRERDEFELCIKELKARNSWLERQVLRSPDALRSVGQERVAAVSQSEEAELPRRAGSISNGGWTGVQTSAGRLEKKTTTPPKKRDAVWRLEHRLGGQLGRGASREEDGRAAARMESTARVRRTLKFLEECDRSIKRQQEREFSVGNSGKQREGGNGGDAVNTTRGRLRQRPRSAQGPSHRPSSSYEGGLFRRGKG